MTPGGFWCFSAKFRWRAQTRLQTYLSALFFRIARILASNLVA